MNSNSNKFKLNYPQICFTVGLALVSKLVAFSWLIGSTRAFFSAINITGPLTVIFGGLPGGLLLVVLNLLFACKSAILLAHTGLPNLIAGLYWKTNSALFKLILPSLCMSLFWYQTWGHLAMVYASLWLVPALIALFGFENIFSKALAATFIAHAIGTNLWLYFGHVPMEQWVLIMPIALLERLCLAVLMTGAYHSLSAISRRATAGHRFIISKLKMVDSLKNFTYTAKQIE